MPRLDEFFNWLFKLIIGLKLADWRTQQLACILIDDILAIIVCELRTTGFADGFQISAPCINVGRGALRNLTA